MDSLSLGCFSIFRHFFLFLNDNRHFVKYNMLQFKNHQNKLIKIIVETSYIPANGRCMDHFYKNNKPINFAPSFSLSKQINPTTWLLRVNLLYKQISILFPYIRRICLLLSGWGPTRESHGLWPYIN